MSMYRVSQALIIMIIIFWGYIVKSYRNMLIILKVLILMKFYNSVKYVYKCMCFGNASYPIPVLDTGKGCYI